ncbi:hypothetical protein CHS0354_030043 [Potamilus streckersoni]|uniref:Uncharacterized protein n=1 Tax=Potamilus streckersoni TaxID=2493646 RepID=A0AAE0WEY7_9BIVA|nr:hypothetical protein CHS0354_030043 [Potamilus streckersoni]
METVVDLNFDLDVTLQKLNTTIPDGRLASPERRNETSRLRREWTLLSSSQIPHGTRHVTQKLREQAVLRSIQRQKTIGSLFLDPDRNSMLQRPKSLDMSVYNQYTHRQTSERPSYVSKVELPPPIHQRYVVDSPEYKRTMFYSTAYKKGNTKSRRQMHIIRPEWSSEKISWFRFYNNNTRDYFKYSWMP